MTNAINFKIVTKVLHVRIIFKKKKNASRAQDISQWLSAQKEKNRNMVFNFHTASKNKNNKKIIRELFLLKLVRNSIQYSKIWQTDVPEVEQGLSDGESTECIYTFLFQWIIRSSNCLLLAVSSRTGCTLFSKEAQVFV